MTSPENAGNGDKPSSTQNVDLVLTEPPLTDGEKMAIGSEAKSIVEGVVWPLAFSNLLQRWQNQSTATDPKEAKKREYLHTKMQILTEVHDELLTYALAAERLSAEQVQDERNRQAAVRASQARDREADPHFE